MHLLFNLLFLLKDLFHIERELQGCTQLYRSPLRRFRYWPCFHLPSKNTSWLFKNDHWISFLCTGCYWIPLRVWTNNYILHNFLLHGIIWLDCFEVYLVLFLHVFYHAILHLLWNDDDSTHTKSQRGFHHCCSILYALEPFQWLYDSSQGKELVVIQSFSNCVSSLIPYVLLVFGETGKNGKELASCNYFFDFSLGIFCPLLERSPNSAECTMYQRL